MKALRFWGTSLSDLRAFPATARRAAGYQLDRIQNGLLPSDGKPMATIGKGVRKIRIRDETGAFRLIYVANIADAVHVPHCFRKTSQKTSKADLALASRRYLELVKEQRP